jgi:ATP-dependent Lon protease
MILLVSQKDVNKEEPTQEDLYQVGTVAIIMRSAETSGWQDKDPYPGLSRCRVESVNSGGDYIKANITPISSLLHPIIHWK